MEREKVNKSRTKRIELLSKTEELKVGKGRRNYPEGII